MKGVLPATDFTIQRVSTTDCDGGLQEGLVLCYKGEIVPFQGNTCYETSVDSNPKFVVSFEVYKGGLEINEPI